jgi:hypothetical protein
MTEKHWVRKSWSHYNVAEIQQLHRRIQQDLGWLNRHWGFQIRAQDPMDQLINQLDNPVIIDYWFLDPRTATLFALKYP